MIGRHGSLIVWAVLGAVVVAVQLAAVVSGRFAGVGEWVGRLTARRVGRCLLVVAWMWLGWHAFAR
jgi:hypothetical protein